MPMKKTFMVIFCAVIALGAVFAIHYINVTTSSGTVSLEIATEEKFAEAKGFIMRDEHVYNAQSAGTVYTNVSEGARVTKDAYVGTVYGGDVTDEKLQELSNIDKKIARAVDEQNKRSYHTSDETSVEGEIASLESQIIEAAAENDIEKISGYKAQINGIRTGAQADENEVGRLNDERIAAEARMNLVKTEIFTDISGAFTTYIDGFEGILNPALIDQYTADMILNLSAPSKPESTFGKQVASGEPVCKVVNNHVWYAVLAAEQSAGESCEAGDTVTLRFKNMANAVTNGQIELISEPDENGNVLIVVKSREYFEGAFAYREADVDIVFESHTGYKVPVFAVRTEEGKHSVIGEIGKKRYTCDCEVLFSDVDRGFAIIESTTDAANKISQMERIVTGD